jgi:hypothetical protein
MAGRAGWPELSEARDRPTIVSLHLFSQIAGKAAVALLPWRNHGWHLTLRLHPRGFRTEPLYGAGGPFELGFDLVDGRFTLSDAAGERAFALRPMSVADFHGEAMALLAQAGHPVRITRAPNEVDPAIPFEEDEELRAWDADSARRLLGALLQADRVLRLFRSAFLGKVSPVHFFWGSFDLAVTRFSGGRRRAIRAASRTFPMTSRGKPIATKSPAPASGRAVPEDRAGLSSIPMPIRRRRVSRRRRSSRRRRASTRRSASSCSITRRCVRRPIPTRLSSPFFVARMRRRPILRGGTVRRWNATRGGRVCLARSDVPRRKPGSRRAAGLRLSPENKHGVDTV